MRARGRYALIHRESRSIGACLTLISWRARITVAPAPRVEAAPSIPAIHRHHARPRQGRGCAANPPSLPRPGRAGLGALASAPGAVVTASPAPCARAGSSSPGADGERRRTIASEDRRARSSRPRRRLRPGLPSPRLNRRASSNSRRRHACTDDDRRAARPSVAGVDTSELATVPFAGPVAVAPAGGVERERSPSWSPTGRATRPWSSRRSRFMRRRE